MPSEPWPQAGGSGRPRPYLAQRGWDWSAKLCAALGLLLATCHFVACALESSVPEGRGGLPHRQPRA